MATQSSHARVMCMLVVILFDGAPDTAKAASVVPDVGATVQSSRPTLNRFLDDHGRLSIPNDFSGSIDPSGFVIVSKPGEPPRFAPKGGATDDESTRWADAFADPGGGCDGRIKAIVISSSGQVYLGGKFKLCGGVDTRNIARWDPETGLYSGLLNGVDTVAENGFVSSLAVAGADLYVGGMFEGPGGAYLRKWDGNAWSSVANGPDYEVSAIAVSSSGILYVGGNFTHVGEVAANHIAQWDGVAWSTLGSGLTNGVNGSVNAISASPSGGVYVGGGFTTAGGTAANNIAYWNGSSWIPLVSGGGNGTNGGVNALAVSQDGEVYVGGDFTQAGTLPANNIAVWTGLSWQPFISGSANGVDGAVNAVATGLGGTVYIGGEFLNAGGTPANRVALWDGASWRALGSGEMNGVVGQRVDALARLDGNILVGGGFSVAGGSRANNVSRWNGTAWVSVTNPPAQGVAGVGSVEAIEVSQSGIVYVGGGFDQVGGTSANSIASWDGTAWSVLGSGQQNGVDGGVSSIASVGTDVYVGGCFSVAGSVTTPNIARWTGSTWLALGSGSSTGVNGCVSAVRSKGSDVYVGGDFTEAGDVLANNLAIWNGSAWLPVLSQGANGVSSGVRAIAVSGEDVYVGGLFSSAGGVVANRIARLNGGVWTSLGDGPQNGVNDTVLAIAIDGGDVLVGGHFTTAGGLSANRIARWGGEVWEALGTGLNREVRSIEIVDSDVYVGGLFFSAGGQRANGIARWDGANWQSLGSGAGNGVFYPVAFFAVPVAAVNALGARGRQLAVGGYFVQAGGKPAAQFSGYDARRAVGVTLSTSENPSTVNSVIVLTGSIVTGGFPTFTAPGTVDFLADGVGIAGCNARPVVGGLDIRSAVCTTSALAVGVRSLTARYSGDEFNFLETSEPLLQDVSVPVITVIPSSLPDGVAGVSYSQNIVASSDSPGPGQAFTYRRVPGSGSLPTGLSLDGATGELSGVPSAAGSFTFTIEAKDGSLPSVGGPFTQTRQYTINVSLQSTSTSIGTINPSPSVTGQAYNVPVTVAGQVGTPTGLVSVNDGTGASCTLPLVSGSGICALTSTTPGPKTITAAYGGQGAFDASVGTKTHVVTLADVPPTLSYNPVSGSGFTLTPTGATVVGAPAQGAVAITASGGLGNGSTSLGCSVTVGFAIVSAPTGPFVAGGGSGQIQVGCTLAAAPVQGTLSCNVTTNPSSTQPAVSWPVTCPGADAVAPTLTFTPPAGNNISFPDGDLNGVALQSVQISASGAVGNGSTVLACSTNSAGFAITGGATQTITATQGAVPLALSCTRIANPRSGTLTCDLTSTPPGSAQASWTMSCPAGTFLSTSRVAVGTRTGVRNARVAVPVSFRGDGATVSFSADIAFDRDKLNFVSAVPLAGGVCTRLAPPNDDRIKVQAPGVATGLPLSAQTETRYCEINFAIGATATAGVVSLPVATSACPDAGGSQTRCTTSAGAVRITAVDPGVPPGTTLSISGYAAQVEKTRTVSIANRGSGALNVDCAVVGASALTLRSASPITVPAQAAGAVTVGCVLPAVGTVLSGQLSCTTNDPVRATLTYGLNCSTLPDGAPLPSDEVFDDQMKDNDRLGSSAALGVLANGTEVMVLGAPFAGSDGNGRVYVLEGTSPSAMRQVAILAAAPRAQDQAAAPSDEFGRAVALSADGQRIAVGALKGGGSGTAAGPGQVWVFDRPAAGWGTASPGPTHIVASDPPISPPLSGGGMVPSEFGAAVTFAPDGTLLIGAPATTVGAPGIGMAYVYEDLGGGLWVLTTPLTSISPAGQGRFGTAVGAAEGMLVVGAPQEGAGDPQNFQRGAAYRIPITGGIAGAAQLLRPAANQAGDRFGSSVAVGGGVVVVGSPGDTTASAGNQSGSATVYRLDTTGNLIEQSTLVPAPGAQQGAGTTLTTNGDIIVMGAPNATVGGIAQRGRAYVYDVEDRYSAIELPLYLLDNADGQSNDAFGAAVAANRRQIVVGVPLDDRLLPPATTLRDIGRADPFGLDRIYRDGLE